MSFLHRSAKNDIHAEEAASAADRFAHGFRIIIEGSQGNRSVHMYKGLIAWSIQA